MQLLDRVTYDKTIVNDMASFDISAGYESNYESEEEKEAFEELDQEDVANPSTSVNVVTNFNDNE